MASTGSGRLFVICGPSGVGKSTLIERLFARLDHLRFSVSMTTRPPRAGERDGIDYHFVSQARFDQAVEAGELLEHARVHNHSYGTPRSELDRARAEGADLLLDIDVQGAKQVKAAGVAAHFIFIAPPSPEALEARLRARGTESPEALEQRLATARRELLERPWFDYCIVNDDLELAEAHLVELLRGLRRGNS